MPLLENVFKRLEVVAATILVATFVATNAFAQSTKQLIEVATRKNLPPYVERNADTGIEIDLIKAIFANTEYEPVFIQQPRVRMIAAFESRQLNGIITQNISASSIGCATDWYIAHQNVAMTLANRNMEFEGLSGLEGLSVLSFSGATRYLGSEFEASILKTKRYTESGDQSKHISLLYMRRFDAVVGDRWILALAQKRHLAKTGEYMPLKIHPIMKPSLYVARFHDQEVCNAFDAGLRRLRASGTYDAIWNGYQNNLMIAADENNAVQQ